MSQSDNVVRAGLTPKFKDVELLLQMCDYRDDLLEDLVQPGVAVQPGVFEYRPPATITDFRIIEVVREGVALELASASVVLMMGQGRVTIGGAPIKEGGAGSRGVDHEVSAGKVFFVAAGGRVSFSGGRVWAFVATY